MPASGASKNAFYRAVITHQASRKSGGIALTSIRVAKDMFSDLPLFAICLFPIILLYCCFFGYSFAEFTLLTYELRTHSGYSPNGDTVPSYWKADRSIEGQGVAMRAHATPAIPGGGLSPGLFNRRFLQPTVNARPYTYHPDVIVPCRKTNYPFAHISIFRELHNCVIIYLMIL